MTNILLKPVPFLILYGFVVLANLIGGEFEYDVLRDFSKPLILLSLLVFFGIRGRNLEKSTYILTLSALFFSWIGDILLQYEHISSSFFIYGLVAFLIAHVFYCILFIKKWNSGTSSYFWLVLLLLIFYGTILFMQLKDGLNQLFAPVIVYILAILLMAITAFRRKGSVSSESFILIFLGALFFIASDSLLAINKFLGSVPHVHMLVMGTYATAQFLITKGILVQEAQKSLRKEKHL